MSNYQTFNVIKLPIPVSIFHANVRFQVVNGLHNLLLICNISIYLCGLPLCVFPFISNECVQLDTIVIKLHCITEYQSGS